MGFDMKRILTTSEIETFIPSIWSLKTFLFIIVIAFIAISFFKIYGVEKMKKKENIKHKSPLRIRKATHLTSIGIVLALIALFWNVNVLISATWIFCLFIFGYLYFDATEQEKLIQGVNG